MPSAAPVYLRFASGLIDGAILAGAEVLVRGLSRREPPASPRMQLQRLLLAGCYFVGTVGLVGRTAGQALSGLRVVGATTGRRPGWRASLLWWAVRQPPEILLLPLSTSSRVRGTTAVLRSMEPEVDQLRRRFSHDHPRLEEAIAELYQSRGVDLWRGYWQLLVVGGLAAAYTWTVTVGVLLRPDHRALYDRLAGVVLVHDDDHP